MKWIINFGRKILKMANDDDLKDLPQKEAEEGFDSETPIPLGPGEFDPDHSISSGYKEDRLGFRSVANKLASSILTQVANHGLVISIEGKWGSGKSSLVNLLADELKNDQEKAPEIVRFEPWLVGDRDGMLTELMSDLATAVEAIEAPEKGEGEKLKEGTVKLSKQLRGYGSKLSRGLTPIARLAEAFGVTGAKVAGDFLEGIAKLTDPTKVGKPLPEIKKELTEGLRKLPRRIVVVIDDLDRLEPPEATEIMRLIRAVADFPNVIYILCFDQKILAGSLQTTLSVDNGTDFLKKMIQVSFKVPQPEAFDLRRWFLHECLAFYNSISKEQLPDDVLQRLHEVCDLEGGLLETPRDVIRAINAIKLYWPPICDKADFPDLVWLQMIRLKHEALYLWIERYLCEFVAGSEGAFIDETGRTKLAQELKELLPDESVGSVRSMWSFKDFIPGIQPGKTVEDKNRLFNFRSGNDISSLEKDRRLGSPHHSRYYFAFAQPAGGLEDTELYSFIASAKKGESLEDLSRALIQQARPQGGTKFEVLIDRLKNLDEKDLPNDAIPSILKALANCMDEVDQEGKHLWGSMWRSSAGKPLFKKLFVRLTGKTRKDIMIEIFTTGKATGWLMCEIIRDQIFAHGIYGDRPQPREEWSFSEEELDKAIQILLRRFKSTDREKIIDTPEVVSLMYGWHQSGDEKGVLEWVQEQQETDEGFLKLLNACRGRTYSDKTYYPLNKRDLKVFMDYDGALERLKGISENADKTDEERALAKELLQATEIGEDN
ncbi:MAG: KAP family NTPase [Nitrospinota bacterium]|nr:KAP family NTPase [Nitrospinota bacterium]